MDDPQLTLPDPDLQIAFSDRLALARSAFLQPALLQTITQCDVRVLDAEAHQLVPPQALNALASRGLRAELVFALPSLLRANPRLIAYYRMVLGFSQKVFYQSSTGLTTFKKLEDGGSLKSGQDVLIEPLCAALNRAAALLISGIATDLSPHHLDALSLLTFGTQLRGGWNVGLGTKAIREVFAAIREIVGERVSRVADNAIEFTDATGRIVKVRFRSDPDIEAVSVNHLNGAETPLLAVEVKGGTDYSNVHNRLGEAEKSHLKARRRGFNDLWTVTNVRGLADEVRSRESPTTTWFADLADVVARRGAGYAEFRDRFLQKVRLPD